MRFSLRSKFFVFAVLVAVAPLFVVGQNLITLAQDELKSAANEQLVTTAGQVREEIDEIYSGSWVTPLLLIRNGIDNEALDVRQKISLITEGLADIPDVVALQLTVSNSDLPVLVTDEAFAAGLREAGLDPVGTLRSPVAEIAGLDLSGGHRILAVDHLPATGDWLATIVMPLESRLAGATMTLSARIDLSGLAEQVRAHPFTWRGEITLVDRTGQTLLEPTREDRAAHPLVAAALPLIASEARAVNVKSYDLPDGGARLGAFAFPNAFPWAVTTELAEADAYAVVDDMTRNLTLWIGAGFFVAMVAAIVFSLRLTRPILKIGEAAERVGQGDFGHRIEGVRARDEIGDLADRMNVMIGELSERFSLMKFVSQGTISAIQAAREQGIERGGERRPVTMLFSDIRGYTAFSEKVDPETVVEMLNIYLDTQAEIVLRHGGDIDKFIGDEVVAQFQGDEMERRAIACGIEIQEAMRGLLEKHPEWDLHVGIGVNAGEVVVGAMGSRDRMDFTVLGDAVNLAARLCSAAPADMVLTTADVRARVGDAPGIAFDELEPIQVKGKRDPIAVYAAFKQGDGPEATSAEEGTKTPEDAPATHPG